MWSDLARPWQISLELAWEAYCDDCIPIGAVVTNGNSKILSRGRNRVYPRRMWGQRPSLGAEIAHAEVEALNHLDYSGLDQHSAILYTTTEPCPMCMGTLYMSGLRTLYYAARDPWAGSVNLLGSTRYFSVKPVKAFGPEPSLESLVIGLFVEQDCSFHDGALPDGTFYGRMREVLPEAVEFGERLWRNKDVQRLRRSGSRADEVFNHLAGLVK